MKIASIAEVRTHFREFLKSSADGPVVVTRNGRPIAVLVGVEGDDDEVERLMAHSPRLRAILEHSRQQIREEKGTSHEEFWAEKPPRKPKKSRSGTSRE